MNRLYQGKVTAIGYRSLLIGDSLKAMRIGHSPQAQPFDADPEKNREQWQSALPSTTKHADYAKWIGRKRTQGTQMIGYRSLNIGDSAKPLGEVSNSLTSLSTLND